MSYTVAEAQRAITELYVGIFNRAPDPEGLAYWTGKLVDEGADIDVVRAAFVDSVEWQNGVGQSTNAQVIQHLYESLFEREPEQEGFEFWLNELETGVTTVDQIVAVLIANASAYDQLTLDNKVDAALYYTIQSGGEDMVNDAGFNGAAATQAVDSVDYTTESLEASYAATDRALEDDGSVFSLTEADDEILEGTQYDDIFRGALNETLNGFDTIDGGDGNDTLEVVVRAGDGNSLGIPGFVDVQNVETLTLDIVNGGIDVELVGGDNFDDALNTVNVYSTGGTADSVRVEADVDEINIGMARDENGALSERGVIESSVYVDVVDADDSDTNTSVAVSTDRGAFITSTGNLADVNAVADGENIEGDSNQNDIRVTAVGDIASVTSVAGDDTTIESLEGNIGDVVATGSFEYSNSSIYVYAYPSDPTSTAGNISSVDATSPTGYVDVLALNDIDEVVARADDGVYVFSGAGDIGSVSAPGWTIDSVDYEANYVQVNATDGTVGTVDALASGNITVTGEAGVGSVEAEVTGTGWVTVASGDGSVGSVDADGAYYVNVDASDDIGTVTATDTEYDVNVDSVYGDIGSVAVDGASTTNITALEGAVGSVDATVDQNVTVTASDDIASVTADAGGFVTVTSNNGGVVAVAAEAGDDINVSANGDIGSVTADGLNVYVDSSHGDIDEVDAAGDEVVVSATDGAIGSVTADAGYVANIYASDGVGSVDATAGAAVLVDTWQGGIGSVDATAGYYVGVTASDDIGSVNAAAGEDGVYVRSTYGDIGTVDATASGWDGDVTVVAMNGDIGSVTADASDTVNVFAYDGAIDSVTANAGYSTQVIASDDIGMVDATTALGNVDVASSYGDIDMVDATAGGGYGDIYVQAYRGDIGSVTADASDNVEIYAYDGAVDNVDATAGGYVDVYASDDIGSVSATAGEGVWVWSTDGDIGSVDASAETLWVAAYSGSVGSASLNLTDGDGVYVNVYGEDGGVVDAAVVGTTSVGNVSVTAVSDDGVDLVVGSLGTVGSVMVDNGSNSYMYVDVHAENDSSVDLTLTADSDADAYVFVGSVTSDAAMTSPTELNLTVADLDNDAAVLTVYAQTNSTAGAGSDEVTRLETINVDGGADAIFELDSLSSTLSTFDGSAGTGDQTVYMTVPGGDDAADQSISITTGTGDDVVDVLYGASDDNGSVTIATGAGDDYVTNDTDIQSATGMLTITTGTGSDSVELYLGSDAVVDVTTGDDNDDVMIMADINEAPPERLGQGGDFAAAPAEDTYVDVDLTVDVGAGDDLVEIYANRDSIEAGSFAMGNGENTLRYFYSPNGTVAWSDADTERFNLDNVSGSVHTLGIDVDLEISDDVTLDITPEVGGVSVLELGGADVAGDDSAHGSSLTIEGAAADFTIVTNGEDDFGDADDSGGDLDSDILTLVTPGVESLTIDHGDSELGVYLSGSDNAALTSLTTIGGDDDVDVALADFDNSLEVSVTNGDGEAEVVIFGGTYGNITVTGSDDVDLSLQSYDYATSTDGQTPLYDRLDVTLGDVRLTNTEDDGQEVKFDIDGTVAMVTDGGVNTNDGAGDVTVGDVYLAGNFDTELEVDDFTDSAITVGDVSVTITTSDDGYESGYVDIDDLDYTTLTMGNVDVDATVGSDSVGHEFDVQIEYADHSTISIGNVTLDQAYASSDTDNVFENLFEVQAQYNEASAITLGDVTANLEGAAFDMDIEYNTDSTIVIGDVNATGTAVEISITDNVAETDDLNITIGNVTMHDNRADGDGMGLFIQDNTDDFSAGLTEISVGNVMMTGSDSAAIVVSGNQGETNDFSVRLVDRLGVQVDIGDVDIAIDASGEDVGPGPGPLGLSNSVVLSATDNDGADITVGNVDVSIAGSDGGLTAGAFIDAVERNYETAYERGDTTVSIGANAAGSSDGALGYALTYLADNTDSEISLGDYTVTVGGSDTDVAIGYAVMYVDNNDDSLISMGDVSMTVEAGAGFSSDAGIAGMLVTDNDYTEILMGDVTLDGATLAALAVSDNGNMDLTMGDVYLGGNGGVTVANNGFSTVEMGDVTQVGAGSDSPVGAGGLVGGPGTGAITLGLAVTDNNFTDVVIGDYTSSEMFANASVVVVENDDSTIEIGNVTLNDVSDVEVAVSGNLDDTEVTLGTVTVNGDGEGDVILDLSYNTDDTTVTVGAVTLNDVSDVDITINWNTDESTNDTSVSVGDILVDSARDFDMEVVGNYQVDVSVGNVTLSDGTGYASGYFYDNDDSTISVGDISLTSSVSDSFMGPAVGVDITENDSSTVTIGSVDLDSGSNAGFMLDYNDNSTLGSDDSTIDINAEGGVLFAVGENDQSTVMFSDVTLTSVGGDVEAYINGGQGEDGSVSLGEFSISASDDVTFDARGDAFANNDDGTVSIGSLSVSVTGDGSDSVVDVSNFGATGLETITVSGGADNVHIQLGDKNDFSDTETQTTLIDLSGMTESDATVLIDFVADGNMSGDKDQDFLNEDAFPGGYSSANLSDDVVIRFGEFATAYVETLVNDNQDNGAVEDFDGVRQTYVFEGSDIGDITIQGFVAGFGAYRDVDLEGGPGSGYEDGRGNGDGFGGAGSNYFDYSTDEADGQAQLRTDRIDFSQFEGVDSLDDLNFEFDDETDSVIITAADGQFDGRIVVTGQGVDADNGETDESIMDRVADSIIFG